MYYIIIIHNYFVKLCKTTKSITNLKSHHFTEVALRVYKNTCNLLLWEHVLTLRMLLDWEEFPSTQHTLH